MSEKYDEFVMGKGAGDARAVAKSIRESTEKAAMLMDPGDQFATVCTFTVEQAGTIADPKAMREHVAKQMAMVAFYLMAD